MRQRYDFGYFLSEGFHSIFTHGFMSFAAVCMIICCLLIMGSFTLVAVNAENMFSDLEAENQFTARPIMRATSCLTACPPMCTGTGSTSIWTISAS